MALTDDQFATIRSWVGEGPTEDQIEEAYLRNGSYDGAVLELLRVQESALLAQPSSLTVPGLSISNGQNLISLEALMRRLRAEGTGLDKVSSGTGTYKIVRPDYR
jgi:hypothetical protein